MIDVHVDTDIRIDPCVHVSSHAHVSPHAHASSHVYVSPQVHVSPHIHISPHVHVIPHVHVKIDVHVKTDVHVKIDVQTYTWSRREHTAGQKPDGFRLNFLFRENEVAQSSPSSPVGYETYGHRSYGSKSEVESAPELESVVHVTDFSTANAACVGVKVDT